MNWEIFLPLQFSWKNFNRIGTNFSLNVVKFTTKAIWAQNFLLGKVLYNKFNFFHWYVLFSYLYIHEWALIVCIFQGIFPFLPSYQMHWNETVHDIPLSFLISVESIVMLPLSFLIFLLGMGNSLSLVFCVFFL